MGSVVGRSEAHSTTTQKEANLLEKYVFLHYKIITFIVLITFVKLPTLLGLG